MKELTAILLKAGLNRNTLVPLSKTGIMHALDSGCRNVSEHVKLKDVPVQASLCATCILESENRYYYSSSAALKAQLLHYLWRRLEEGVPEPRTEALLYLCGLEGGYQEKQLIYELRERYHKLQETHWMMSSAELKRINTASAYLAAGRVFKDTEGLEELIALFGVRDVDAVANIWGALKMIGKNPQRTMIRSLRERVAEPLAILPEGEVERPAGMGMKAWVESVIENQLKMHTQRLSDHLERKAQDLLNSPAASTLVTVVYYAPGQRRVQIRDTSAWSMMEANSFAVLPPAKTLRDDYRIARTTVLNSRAMRYFSSIERIPGKALNLEQVEIFQTLWRDGTNNNITELARMARNL